MRIPINLSDYKEPTIAPVGARYNLIIAACEESKSKAQQKPQYTISIGFEGHPEFQNLRHTQSLPGDPRDTPEQTAFKAILLRRFLHMFKVPYDTSGIDTEKLAMELVGAKAVGEVGIETEKDADGNEKTDGRRFNRLVVPYLPQEASAPGGNIPGRVAAPKA